MNRLCILLEKQFLGLEELEELECMPEVNEVGDNGISGRYYGKHLYTVYTDRAEYEVYSD